ncbi:MAG: PhnD/SsuA/transferrin family substrate-binding protein [Anaerolineae bacterium]|nr:PhnD/SsuA/transferrin family substrate-binding protein [Anaerolineae bacterium]
MGILLLLLIVLAGCGGDDGPDRVVFATEIPVTVTPRSTPLPPVANAPQLGEGPRQIELLMAVFGDDAPRDARNTGIDLQSELADELDLTIRVRFTNETEALAALCSGAPRAAWVSAYTYVKAQQLCEAVPVLAMQRGRTPRVVIGQTAEIVSRVAVERIDQMRANTFCRSTDQDYFTGWVYPELLLTSNDLNLGTDVSVAEYPRLIDMGRALYHGDCNAIALPPDEFDDFVADLTDQLNTDGESITTDDLEKVIHVLQPAGNIVFDDDDMIEADEGDYYPYGDGVIPYEVLVFAPDSVIPDQLRQDITSVIEDFLNDRVDGDTRLEDLLDATGVMPVQAASYDSFSTMLLGAGWDMTATD